MTLNESFEVDLQVEEFILANDISSTDIKAVAWTKTGLLALHSETGESHLCYADISSLESQIQDSIVVLLHHEKLR